MLLSSNYTSIRVAHSKRIDIGNGFYFQDTTNPKFVGESSEGKLHQEGTDKLVGYLATYIYPEVGHTIAAIVVYPNWRGQSLGEKMVKAFVKLHGSLASDPQGNTSATARRMWRRLGAEEVPTNKNTQGFFYILRKS
jgi:GNAT superfamily N-acetyltransferase